MSRLIVMCIFFLPISLFSQTHISGKVVVDTILYSGLRRANVIIVSETKEHKFRTDRCGKFEIVLPKEVKTITISIEKKGFVYLRLENIKLDEGEMNLLVMLGKVIGLHSEGEGGKSYIIKSSFLSAQ